VRAEEGTKTHPADSFVLTWMVAVGEIQCQFLALSAEFQLAAVHMLSAHTVIRFVLCRFNFKILGFSRSIF